MKKITRKPENSDKSDDVKLTRRSLLTKVSAISGVVALSEWTTPVVKSVVLPAHAQTSSILTINNLRATSGNCEGTTDPDFTFNIEYDFESTFGVVSHTATTGICPDTTFILIDGNPVPGGNLLNATISVILTGNEFSGHMRLEYNRLTWEGVLPLECEIIVTLTDADGGTVSDTLALSECGTTPPP